MTMNGSSVAFTAQFRASVMLLVIVGGYKIRLCQWRDMHVRFYAGYCC